MKIGSRWKSVVDETQVIAVRAPAEPVDVLCGGHPMIPIDAEPPAGMSLHSMHADGTQLGKRYANEELGLELLCIKAGAGSLSVDGAPILLKDSKPLPSSD